VRLDYGARFRGALLLCFRSTIGKKKLPRFAE
jgi:hypothetical protein